MNDIPRAARPAVVMSLLAAVCALGGCASASAAAASAAKAASADATHEATTAAKTEAKAAAAQIAPVLASLDCAAAGSMDKTAVDALITASLAGKQRAPEHVARDVYRHPKDTLDFFGLRPTMNVVELWPGGGWYTEVLAPLLRDCGHLSSAAPHSDSYAEKLRGQPNVYDKVTTVDVDTKGDISLGPDGAADMVVTFRNIHNWMAGGYEDKIYAAAFRALKPGGIFGVVEHRAKKGADEAESSKKGYVDEDAVIKRIEKAGFVLEEKSELNANPNDTKDYEKGVWTLPPALRLGDVDKAKYLAIGESDRMTLRFKKPAK